ncbi:hypothetical protein SRABI83_01656 [Arthrobacter sp. Bi83]|uniref:DUF6177 family protein n=1 Tax=Arthrobacter sp. Bi83 TaxID=2822353 RepID=UPI001D7924B0|nr:DUF6177 family protein [Arthrobacter sp. Bi83]CAH0190579.1 hypothetical protein SRABI83_01656 [Arthrobacter sp. Bi83]
MNAALPLLLVAAPAPHPWLSRSLRAQLGDAARAAAPGSVVALQTQPLAAPSYPLLAFLKASGVTWVTEVPSGTGLCGAFSARGPGDAPAPHPAVVLHGSVLHAASHELVIGDFTAGMLQAVTGGRPEYAGPAEPLGQPWETAPMTTWFRKHMPSATMLFSGRGFAGALTVARTGSGVVESFDAMVSAEVRADPSRADPDWRSAEKVAVACGAHEFGVELHFGADGLAVPAGHDGFRVPQLALMGPGLVRQLRQDLSTLDGVSAEFRGSPPLRHLAVRFPEAAGQDAGGWDAGRALVLRERLLLGLAADA